MAFLPPVPAQVSAGNSTSTPLAANGVFTGTAIDVTTIAISQIVATVNSNVGSAVNGFQIQYSTDSITWIFSVQATVVGNVASVLVNGSLARYIRVVYTNGPTIQASFVLQTLLSNLPPTITSLSITNFPATQPISGAISFTAPQHTIVDSATLGTVTVSGTVTTAPPANASENIAQWAGTTLGAPTNFGTTPGAVVAASVNSSVFIGTTAAVAATAGVQLVGIEGRAGTSLESTAGVLDVNNKNINNSAIATAAAGVQKVGVVGNSGATLDCTIAPGTAPTNAVLTASVFDDSSIPTPTVGQTLAVRSDSSGALAVNVQGRKNTFRMGVRGFVPVASATSPLFSIQGSATKVVRITRIKITWSCTTGTALQNDIFLQKFSALTGGTTGNTPTGAKNDVQNAAQTAVCLQYSAVPTTATSVGGVYAVDRITWITSGAAVNSMLPPVSWTAGDMSGQALTLRGTSEYFGVVCGAVGTTPLMSIWIEWTEE